MKGVGHGDLRAVRQSEVRAAGKFFDEAENVIPAAAIQTGAVLAQFVKNFLHSKAAEDGFDQNRRVNGAVRKVREVPARNTKTSFHKRASRWISILGR